MLDVKCLGVRRDKIPRYQERMVFSLEACNLVKSHKQMKWSDYFIVKYEMSVTEVEKLGQ